MMKNKGNWPMIIFWISVVAVVLAAVVNVTGSDIFGLAGTQWILIGIVMAVWANYLNACGCCDCSDKNKQQ